MLRRQCSDTNRNMKGCCTADIRIEKSNVLSVGPSWKRNMTRFLSEAVASPRGGLGGHMPPKWDPFCASKYIKEYLKIYSAADKPNGMKYDCIRIHALHGCVITNVVIQSTAIASLPATSFPGSYLRSSGEMTRCW